MSGHLSQSAILLVDDDPTVLLLYTTVLHRAGFTQVHGVGTAAAALDILGLPHCLPPVPSAPGTLPPPAGFRPALVLLDVVLPDLNGFDVCRRIKRQGEGYLPVLLLTGYHRQDDNARFVACGADDFLAKTTRTSEVVARCHLLLARGRAPVPDDAPVGSQSVPCRPGDMPDIGSQLGGQVLTAVLGWSSAAMVYRGRRVDGSQVVVKMLTGAASAHADVRTRFIREATMMWGLHHPAIVRVWEVEAAAPCPYYVMEFVPGHNAEMEASLRAPLPLRTVGRIATSLAEALAYLHAHGLVHRDVKPRNVHVLPDGHAKLGDFGIATALGETRLTDHGYAIGSPLYMAPEAFTHQANHPAADIYAYGVTLYHLLTGAVPFVARSVAELLEQHQQQAPPPLATRRPGLPPGWEELICRQCLAKDPAQRPASMQHILATLADLAEGAE